MTIHTCSRYDYTNPKAGARSEEETTWPASPPRRPLGHAGRSSPRQRELFAEQGYAETATREVVERAGVTRGALYHHFSDKADLFRAVFVEIEEELNGSVATRAIAEQDPRMQFLAGCSASLEFAKRPDYLQVAVVDAPAVLGEAEWHAVDAAIGTSSMEFGLATLHQAGLLSKEPSRELAVLLFGALTEAVLAVARGDGEPEEYLPAFTQMLEGVAPDASRWPLPRT